MNTCWDNNTDTITRSIQEGVSASTQSYAKEKEHVPLSSVFVGLLIIASASISKVDDWNYVAKGLGVFLGFVYLIRAARIGLRLNAEIWLYLSWISWSLLALVGGAESYFFWVAWFRSLQIWFLLLILSSYTFSQKTLSFNLACYLIGAIIVAGYSYVTGEYKIAREEGQRVVGLAVNPNTFGWILLLSIMALSYFFMLPSKKRVRKTLIIVVIIALMAVAMVLSGSRKAILSLFIFFPVWIYFCYRKEVRRHPLLVAGLVLLIFIGSFLLMRVVSESKAGERFEKSWSILKGETKTEGDISIRFSLYKQAFAVLSHNMFIGIGLNNLRLHTMTRQAAHSEYLEVACATGIIGFAVYFSIFVLLWRRAGKIAKYTNDPVEKQIVQFIRAVIIIVMIMNLGRWNYDDVNAWIIFSSLIGYTNAVWNRIQSENYASDYIPIDEMTESQSDAGVLKTPTWFP